MRVIVDTNVFISGIFWPGPPSRIMDLWADGKLQIVLSTEIFEEYKGIRNIKGVFYEIEKYLMSFPLLFSGRVFNRF